MAEKIRITDLAQPELTEQQRSAIEFTDTLEGTFSLRYDEDTRENTTLTEPIYDPTGGIGITLGEVRKETWDELQPKLTLRYRPTDTLTILASAHNPETEEGFLWLEAWDPETSEAIEYNYLIGSCHVVKTGGGSADGDFLWAYTPYAFVSRADGTTGASLCGFDFTDDDGEGDADFDGVEYDFFPARLYLDNFFAEDGAAIDLDNRLYLMVADRGVTDVSILAWDNNENRYSIGTSFDCWFGDALQSISLLFLEENLDDDAVDEIVLAGGATVYTGWMELTPDTSPLLGAFYTVKQDTDLGAGRELQYAGTWDADGDGYGADDAVEFERF